jgi:hypothetical protein
VCAGRISNWPKPGFLRDFIMAITRQARVALETRAEWSTIDQTRLHMPSSSDLVRLRIRSCESSSRSKGAQSNSTRSSFEGGAGSSPTSAPHQQARVRDWRDLSRFFPRKGCGRRLVLDYDSTPEGIDPPAHRPGHPRAPNLDGFRFGIRSPRRRAKSEASLTTPSRRLLFDVRGSSGPQR